MIKIFQDYITHIINTKKHNNLAQIIKYPSYSLPFFISEEAYFTNPIITTVERIMMPIIKTSNISFASNNFNLHFRYHSKFFQHNHLCEVKPFHPPFYEKQKDQCFLFSMLKKSYKDHNE